MNSLESAVSLIKGESEEFLSGCLNSGSCHWRQFARMWHSGECRDTGFLGMHVEGLAALIACGVPADTEVGSGIAGPNLDSQYGGSWYIDDEGYIYLCREIQDSFYRILGHGPFRVEAVHQIITRVFAGLNGMQRRHNPVSRRCRERIERLLVKYGRQVLGATA